MATNAPRSLQVYDPLLSGIARRYRPKGFIARKLIPSVPVSTLSSQYPVFTKDFWFREHTDNRVSDRAPSREIDFEWSTESFICEEYALKVSITDLERQQAPKQLRLEKNKTELLTGQMELSHEVRVAALLMPSGDGGQLSAGMTVTPSVNWDQATATIESDIKTGVEAIYDACGGLLPNVIVIPFKVAYAMALQEDIRNIMAEEKSGEGVPFIKLGHRVLPSVIHGMSVVIPHGVQKGTGREGGSTSISELWGDHVRLLYVDTDAEWGIPTVAQEFRHMKKTITRWSTVDPDVDYVREKERYDLKAVAPDAGFVIKSVLS